MKTRGTGLFILAVVLLTGGLITGCALFGGNEEDLPSRNVRVLAFPVRPVEFRETRCRQDMEKMELSGTLKNVSYSPLSNVQVRVRLFYSGDFPGEDFSLPVIPAILQPGQTGTFTLSGKVNHTMSYVELHVRWQE